MSLLHTVQKSEVANSEGLPVLDIIVEDYFSPIQKFGRESANGSAYKVGWDGVMEWICVLKIAKGNAKEDADLFHELAVGLALNILRKKVANFMYVWGGFYCKRPLQKSLQCGSTNPDKITTLALFELIEGKELAEWAKSDAKFNSVNVYGVVMQVACALALAQQEFKFMHYDLHGGNILVRKLKTKEEFTIEFGKRSITVKSRYVPQLIDYGMSSMIINGKFVTSRFSEKIKTIENVVDLQGSPKEYFMSLYDIWRYVSFTVGEFYLNQMNPADFASVWKLIVEPFFEIAREYTWSEKTDFYKCVFAADRETSIHYLLKTAVSRDLSLEDIQFLKTPIERYIDGMLRASKASTL
jgi:hypothetical protein